jgi:hypothetical protein
MTPWSPSTPKCARDRAQLVVVAYRSGLVQALPPTTDR